jgi:hypothetical protein
MLPPFADLPGHPARYLQPAVVATKNAGRLLDFPGTEKNTGKMPCSASEELMPDRNLMETADAF